MERASAGVACSATEVFGASGFRAASGIRRYASWLRDTLAPEGAGIRPDGPSSPSDIRPQAVGAPQIDVEQPAHSGVLRQGIPTLGKFQQAISWFIRTVFACYACSVELVDLEQEIEQTGKAMVLCYVDDVLITPTARRLKEGSSLQSSNVFL